MALGYGFNWELGRTIGPSGPPPIITGTAPQLGPLTAGDTLASAFTPGNYLSSAGTIVEPVPTEQSLNFGAWEAYVGSTVTVAGQSWRIRQTPADNLGNTRTFTSQTQFVALATAPVVLSYFGGEITYTVDAADSGQYADGSYWAVGSLTGMTPAFETGVTRTLTNATTVPNTEVHGWMVDPGNALRYKTGDLTTLAQRQAVNFGNGATGGVNQAYDSWDGNTTNLAYDATKKTPLPITSGAVVKAKSRITDVSTTARPALDYKAVLTLVDAPPAAGSIRPPVARADKSPVLNVSTLNLGRLRNLDVSGITGRPTFQTLLEWLSGTHTFQNSRNVNSRNIIPLNGLGLDPYYGTTALQFSQVMLAMHTNALDMTQKTTLAIQIGKIAGDIAGAVNEGRIFSPNGGHSHGRLTILAFAAELFDSAYLRDACSVVAASTIANEIAAGQSVYGDLTQLYYATQPMIDASATEAYPIPQAHLGWPMWGSQFGIDPTGIVSGNILGNVLDGTDNTGVQNAASYQGIVGKSLAGSTLALRLLQGASANVPRLLHDYADRYINVEINGAASEYVEVQTTFIAPQTDNPTPAWVREAYTAFSPLVDVWTPDAEPVTAVIVGQSQEEYYWNPSDTYNAVARPTITGGNMTVHFVTSAGTAPSSVVVTNAALQAKQISISIGVLSQALNYIAPGRYFHIGAYVVNGTSRFDELQASNPDRRASDMQAVVNAVRASSGKDIDAYIECWMGDDSGSAKTMHESFAPMMYLRTHTGAAFTPGSTNPAAGDPAGRTVPFDEGFRFDADAAAGDLGRGFFRKNATAIHFLGWPTHGATPANSLEGLNFTTDSAGGTGASQVGRAFQHNRPARANYRALFDQGIALGISGYWGPGPHSAFMESPAITHPLPSDVEGPIDLMWARLPSLLHEAGFSVPLPTFGTATIAGDRRTITIPVNMPAGAVLTTKAILRGQTFPATPSPHQQEVTGFELQRPGQTYNQRRPIYRTDSGAGYPDTHKGTVTIVGNTIRIVMAEAIPAGEFNLYYLDGDVSAHTLDPNSNPRDSANRLYRHFPLAHFPAWYDAGFVYPFPGMDFDTQVMLTVAAGTSSPMTNTVSGNLATWGGDAVITNVVAGDLAEWN